MSEASIYALQLESAKRTYGDMMREIKNLDPNVRRKRIGAGAVTAAIAATAGFFSFLNNVDGKPHDALVGIIPLDIVTYYDFAESDSVVKYRAFGGEFFAHQGGDKTALRVDFMLVGSYKDVWINALRMLRLACKSTTRGQTLTNQDESYLFDPHNAPGEGLWTFKNITRRKGRLLPVASPGEATSLNEAHILSLAAIMGITGNPTYQDIQEIVRYGYGLTAEEVKRVLTGRYTAAPSPTGGNLFDLETESYISTVPSNTVDPLSIQRMMTTDDIFNGWRGEYAKHSDQYYKLQQLGYFTYHFNFPVIIDNLVFPNMWLETVQFTKDSRNGVDAIVGHLLLRKYIKPPRIRWTSNGRNVSRLQTQQEIDPETKKVKSTKPIDKWVWIWQDKVSAVPQLIEYGTQIGIGIARAAFRNITNPYKYINASLFQQQYRAINSNVSFPAL